jgi:hypothetical protein
MRKWAFVIASFFEIAPSFSAEAVGQRPIVKLSKTELAAVYDGIRKTLKDPDSAQFGETLAVTLLPGMWNVCGWVNAKNSYGGYTGRQPFYGSLVVGPKGSFFSPIAVGGGDEDVAGIHIACAKYDMKLPD